MKIQRTILKHKNHLAVVMGLLIVLAYFAKVVVQWPLGYTASLLVASIIGFVPIFIQSWQALKARVISIELLVTIAVAAAFVIGEYNESAIVTFLFLFGGLLEQKTLEKTRSSIKELTQLAPASALRVEGSEIVEVEIEDVEAGDVLVIKTGARVPVDGKITEGSGFLNEASVTGESSLSSKTLGDQVFAGTILENGTLKVTAEKVGEDTTFGKIIELVEEAQDSKSSAERFIDRFAKFYTPIVLLLALIVGLVTRDIRLAITILVLGCPGALVIGVPVSNVAGIGNGAKHGILIKGSEVTTLFSKIDTFVFDKTGTLTKGKPEVSQLKSYRGDASDTLRLLASVERESDHPLGQAILNYAKETNYAKVEQTQVIKGQGLEALVAGQTILVGNQQLFDAKQVTLDDPVLFDLKKLQAAGNSTILVAIDGQLTTLIGIKDQVRSEAKQALQALRASGAKRLIMLSGDNQATASQVGEELALDEIHGNLLPEDKAAFIKQLKAEGHKVAFVGDGINDSPSIALADVGIAMGSGTDVAVETSDVVLMKSGLNELAHAYGLTKKTVLNMKENIVLSIAVVLFLLVGLIFGYIYMASGMFVHELSIFVVILNGMRLLVYGKKKKKVDSYQVQVS
jgi:Cd2+/Zn2+-exporting ATPase